MVFYINVVFFLFSFPIIYSFLILSMEVKNVDDCIRKIDLVGQTNLYERGENITCDHLKGKNLDYNKPIFEPIPYEIGQKIKIIIGDEGIGECYFKMDISVNNKIINESDMKFWTCDNCNNYGFNYEENYLSCYQNKMKEPNDYIFYFKINSLNDLDIQTSEYLYYFNNTNDIFLISFDFNNAMHLLDLYSVDKLYAKNSEGNIITPFYKYIYYKLFFEEYKIYNGKFIGSDDSNNDIELNEDTYSRIFENKNLRYVLSEEEKENRGIHLKIKIGIYNNQKKLISELQDFNFFICFEIYFCGDNGKCSCDLVESEINEDYLIGKAYIKLKIKGKGINRIFYSRDQEFDSYFIPPNEVIINNVKKNYVNYEYDFINDINNVILIWNDPVNNIQPLFYGCSNITEVDLSYFDSSSLLYIGGLFKYCSSLTYVNFTNFNTDQVQIMRYMFSGCDSLKSLDLSNFNTESVTDMKYMFHNCNNLHYLNLKNFKQKENLDYTGIFDGIPNNIIVCINEEKAPSIYQLIINLENSYIDCSDDWFINNNILCKKF